MHDVARILYSALINQKLTTCQQTKTKSGATLAAVHSEIYAKSVTSFAHAQTARAIPVSNPSRILPSVPVPRWAWSLPTWLRPPA